MDWTTIISTIISSALVLIGVIISNNAKQAVTDEKIQNLTNEVHNLADLEKRTYAIETNIARHEDELNRVNHRLKHLEDKNES